MNEISLRPIREEDILLLKTWLHKDYILKWYYDCFYANDMEDWYDVVQKNDTFSIDYLIGEEAYLGKGYGKAIVSLLTRTIKEKEKAKQIIVQPEKENIPSNKALLSNGYVFDEIKDYYYKILE